MKIAYIIRSLVQKAGAERVMIDKMNYLCEKPGYEIFLITYEQGNHPMAYPLSEKVKHINIDTPFYTLYKYGIVKRITMFIAMRLKFRRELTQHIICIHPDITVGTTLSYTLIGTIVGLKDTSKKVIETHSERNTLKQRGVENNPLLNYFTKQYDNHVAKQIGRADALVTLTQEDAHSWRDVTEAVVIPNVLTYYPPEVSHPKAGRQIISAGRLEEQKGYDLLIDAWQITQKKHPDWTLHIYGTGSLENRLKEKIIRSGLEKSCIIHPPTNQIYDRYMESEFYVLSSRYEGFGLVLSEAMSCGVPCIAFNCPCGPSDIISHQVDGILVDNGNIEQFAKEMNNLIEYPEERMKMGREARENVKRYLPQNVMPLWESLFESLNKQNIK